ncbi:MAG: NAD-binding protein [Cyanobium sp. MAG06]|nr:NAD-binding protein [Cyanobium sp. MAG06]
MDKENENNYDTIILGYGRVGYEFMKAVKNQGMTYLVVDYNPDTAKNLRSKGVNFIYGDAADIEFLEEINISNSKLILSTIPDHLTNIGLINEYRRKNKDGNIIVFGQTISEAETLYKAGASYVIVPHYLGAYHLSEILDSAENGKYNFEKIKKSQEKLFARK